MKSPDRDAADELLPCPFCGPGQSICDTWFDDLAQKWRVGCGRCGASSGTNQDILAVIASWNRRPDASELATLRRRVAEMEGEQSLNSALEILLAEADAVVNYDTTRGWPRYGLEPPILKAGEDAAPRSRALKRHAERHKPSPLPPGRNEG